MLPPEVEAALLRAQEAVLAAIDERWRNSFDSFAADKKVALRAWHDERMAALRTLTKIRKSLEYRHVYSR